MLLRPATNAPHIALLTWSASDLGEGVVQVYLNGRLHDVVWAPRRATWLHVDERCDVRIELLAVAPHEAWLDRSGGAPGLGHWDPPFVTGASLALLRDEALPADARIVVHIDGEAHAPRPLWDAGEARGGFGGLLGIGAFGFDLATGPGHGLGELGVGPFGAGGSAWRWAHSDLEPGEHSITAEARDPSGRIVATLPAPQSVTIDAPPRAARNVRLGEGFTLRWE